MGSAASIAAPKVRQAQLARDLGVSRQSINELVKRGVIVADGSGLIDVGLARIALADRLHPSAKTAAAINAAPQPPVPPPPAAAPDSSAGDDTAEHVTSYHVAKTLREIAEARLAELKLAEQRGELVRVAEVEASLAAKVAALREGFLQMPARLAPIMAAESDQARCHDILQAELRQVLEQMLSPPPAQKGTTA